MELNRPDMPRKYDFKYASELTAFIREQGDFSVSGACYPETHLVSKLFFDNQIFYDFTARLKKADIRVPVEAGIMPVTNKAQIEKMVTMCGASLPEKFRRILDRYGDNREALSDAGMAYALNQIVELIAYGVDGIHIFTMNNPRVAGRICDGIRNLI